MLYQQCLDWLYSQLPMFQRTGIAAYKTDIGNIVQACDRLGNPHEKFKSVHVAGTNGKGSTSHMIASILQEAGYKTGLYTSPHLKDFRERIRINGEMIKKEIVINFIENNKEWFSQIGMSFFEMTVALAFHHFCKEKVDIAIIEVGLGGRLDSTNIIKPELSIITNISLDHTELLGNNIKKIAKEKAGIIKSTTPTLIGRKQKEVYAFFEEYAKSKKSTIYYSINCDLETDLKGIYQKENKNTAVTAIKILKKQKWNISKKNIINGLKNVQKNTPLLGRWTILCNSPLIICDTGHNEDGIKYILKEISQTKFKKLHFILGMVKDKSIDKILKLLPKKALYYFCQAKVPRSIKPHILQLIGSKYHLMGDTYSSVHSALKTAKMNAEEKDLIFVGGSTYVVGEVI